MKNRQRSILLFAGLAVMLLADGRSVSATRKTDVKGDAPSALSTAASSGRLLIMSSSHQDIAWMDSPEKCMTYRDENCITPALAMMAKDPAYRFTMENMLNLMEYIERHPERREEVARYTREGRLEWGATFNQPYESLLSGEQLVREVYYGRRWLRKNFPGCDAVVYFNPDVPGRALQMQQILSKAGIPYLMMSRYHEGLYRWASPDGSSVLAFSPGHYGNAAAWLNAPPAEAVKQIGERLAKWKEYIAPRGLPPVFPLLNSVDFSKPTDFRPLIGAWNDANRDAPGPAGSIMAYASSREFFEALEAASAKLDTISGERPNLWLYIHGPTHHWAITAQREAGRLLPAAEIFATARTLLEGSFKSYPASELDEAWQAAIYPDHGWGGKEGQVTDRLFRTKYEAARDAGARLLDEVLSAIAARVKTRPEVGVPIIVFNALTWSRSDPVTVAVEDPRTSFNVCDETGRVIPHQVLPPLAGQAPEILRLEFIAAGVPGLGYKTFYLTEGSPLLLPASPTANTESLLENGFYRIILVPGGAASIFDKELNREILDARKFLGFEVFTMSSIGNGAGEFGRVQQPTMDGFDRLSLHRPAWRLEEAESGPLRAVVSFTQRLRNCTVREKLILYNYVKRIDVEVDILDWDGEPYREFRLAVPVAAPGGQVAYEVPLGVVEVGRSEVAGTGGPAYGRLNYDEPCAEIRPREVQNFISASGGDFGVTLSSSAAVCDFKDPTDAPVEYPILQPVLLASRRSCHGEGNWYLQEGDHHYRFSFTSHLRGWKYGYRTAVQANDGLRAVVVPPPAAGAEAGALLPETKSFFSVSAPNVLVSTVKKAEDDDTVVVRFYDIEGKASEVRLEVFAPLAGAVRTNIIEDEEAPLKVLKNGVTIPVGHHAIETLKLRPAPPAAAGRHSYFRTTAGSVAAALKD